MTNNTIPNVPRELLADLLGNDHDKRIMAERHLLAMLANAPSPAGVDANHVEDVRAMVADPSPAGVDGLEVALSSEQILEVFERNGFRIELGASFSARGQIAQLLNAVGEIERLSDATAIIDGLRGDLAVALKVPSAAAMRAYLDTECAKDNMRLGTERDQQAQRIGELEGLLRDSAELIKHGVFEDVYCCCGSSVDSHCLGDGHAPVDALAYHAGQVCERIDAALYAGKEGE